MLDMHGWHTVCDKWAEDKSIKTDLFANLEGGKKWLYTITKL